MPDHEGVPTWEELCRSAQAQNALLLADNASMNERLEMAQRWEAHAKEQLDRLRHLNTTLEGESQGLAACLDAVREALALPEGEPAPYGELAGHVGRMVAVPASGPGTLIDAATLQSEGEVTP